MRTLSKVVLAILFSLVSTTLLAEQYTLKFSHVVAPGTPKGKAADLFAKLVHERLGDKVKVEVFPNSQLYDDDKVLEAMRLTDSKTTGIIAAPSLSKFVKFSKKIQAFDLPYLFESVEDVHKLVDSPVMDKMMEGLDKKGLKALTVWDNGMKVFSIKSNSPLRQIPDDFKGKKFRIQSSNISARMIEAMGGTPQKLSFKEVYTALSQRSRRWSGEHLVKHAFQKFYEVQDYISVSNHSYLGYLMVVSNDFWTNLPADIRDALTAALNEATTANRQYATEADLADRKKVEDDKYAKVIELSKEERAAWKKATQPVWAEFRDEIGGDLIDDIVALLKK